MEEYLFLIIDTQESLAQEAEVRSEIQKHFKQAGDIKMAAIKRQPKEDGTPKLKRKPDDNPVIGNYFKFCL